MWKGKVTEEFINLYKIYEKQFHGQTPDMYDDFNFNAMTYEEFISLIKEALAKNVEIPELFEDERCRTSV